MPNLKFLLQFCLHALFEGDSKLSKTLQEENSSAQSGRQRPLNHGGLCPIDFMARTNFGYKPTYFAVAK